MVADHQYGSRIEAYEDSLKDLLQATRGPTEKLLVEACKLVFEHTGKSNCKKSFPRQQSLVRDVEHVRECKSVTSGKKAPDRNPVEDIYESPAEAHGIPPAPKKHHSALKKNPT